MIQFAPTQRVFFGGMVAGLIAVGLVAGVRASADPLLPPPPVPAVPAQAPVQPNAAAAPVAPTPPAVTSAAAGTLREYLQGKGVKLEAQKPQGFEALDITLTEEAGTAAEPAPLPAARPRTAPRGPGWYRGELHSHTYHSDATGRTVAELVQMARGEGLDFIFLTDHNTTAGLAEMDALAADDLLTAGGIELTTFWGHALCLGTRDWVDWRVRPNSGEMERIAAATYGRGQVFVIAHPQSPGDPACTGCSWRFGDMMPGNAEVVEIWNGPWGGDSNNEPSLALWYDWLNQGQRLAATAGTDTHSSRDYAARPGFNVVYAEALTEAALLKAIRAGRLYMSAGPRLGLEARGEGGERWTMGDTAARPATFTAGWAGCPDGARLRVMANGRSLAEQPAAGEGSYTWAMAPGDADWVVVEIRDAGGELLAISNPIYLRP